MRWIDPETTFSRQLSSGFVFGVILMAVISSSFITFVSYHRDRNTYKQMGVEITNSLVDQIHANASNLLELAPAATQRMLGFSHLQLVLVFDAEFNELFVRRKGRSYPSVFGWQGVSGQRAQFVRETEDAYYYAAPIYGPVDKADAVAYVLTTFDKRSILEMLQDIFLDNAIVLASLAFLLLIALRSLIRRVTTPLEQFSSLMIRAESGESGLRAEYDSSAELSTMSHAFNQFMTMLEQREEQLTSSRDQALSVAKVKSDFAANVSHEIRTPLNGILGMINLLKEMGLPQHQQEYLDVASKSGDTLLLLINDVLDFSKIESGNYELDMQPFDLRQNIEQLAILYAEKVQVKDLEMCLNIPAEFPSKVVGDPIRLRQVMGNLLNNAIKFTENGQVTLEVRELSRGGETGLFEFVVADSGIGIPQNAQTKIFDPFGQVDSNSSTKYGGTGLGLTIVKQLVTLMGGDISLVSKPGQGSRFSFVLPLQVQQGAETRNHRALPELKGKRILVVDPFEVNRQYLADLLQHWGLDAQFSENLNEAMLYLDMEQADSQSLDFCLFNLDFAGEKLIEFIELFKVGRYATTQLISMLRFGMTMSAFDVDGDWIQATLDRPIRYDALRQTLTELTLPVAERASRTELPKPVREQFSSLEVLVVDDNQTNQLVAKAMLKELGIVADAVTNGLEAVDFFNDKPYDLILMDCNMPIMDGYEATRRIRSMGQRGKEVAILALTAKDKQSDLEACIDVGMNDYLLKPFELKVLVEKIHAVLGNSEKLIAQKPRDDSSILQTISDQVFDTLALHTGASIGDIVNSYLIDTPIYLSTLMAAMEAADVEKSKELAHKIKGSSRNLGAMKLVALCQKAEMIWDEKKINEAELNYLIVELDNEFKQVERLLIDKLDGLEPVEEVVDSKNKAIVLIVDDDRSTRMTISNVLEREGLQTEFGSNGREAVSLYELLRPNIVIMDALMPVKDGFQACREIKALPNGDKTPVLITTALENEKSVNLAFEAGAADFIPKPINLSVLRQRVRRLLENQASERHVHRLAFNDVLTGLPNRVAFTDQLKQELDHAQRGKTQFAVMFVDLDRFKNINDTLGHDAGDQLLKALTGRLSNCIRSGDMLARLGGDEFIVILSHLDGRGAIERVAQKMLNALKSPFSIAGHELFAGVSIGIAVYPDDGEDKDNLLKNADTAMYKAKASGRNNYQFYTQEMSQILADRMRLESELRKVVQDEDLSLYLQPKYDVQTGQVVGSEALVRWQHQLKGYISPEEFIPISEEMGLIHDIGMWVLKTACEAIKGWQDDHDYQGSVAVNVSAVQLADEHFVANVMACLKETRLDPAFLELEITESIVMEDAQSVIVKLRQLRNMGIHLAIDDFGTGYSSFNYLKQLPVNTLKLDREFISDIPNNKADCAVVDGLITLAHNLDLKVVAEGIEEQEQFEFLKRHGCDIIQGYLISKPMPLGDFEARHVVKSGAATESQHSPSVIG